jgi:hypothetical protein
MLPLIVTGKGARGIFQQPQRASSPACKEYSEAKLLASPVQLIVGRHSVYVHVEIQVGPDLPVIL